MKDELSSLCSEFVSRLASPAPTPGGGGAAALCGALSASLCSMAGELSLGKKSTAQYSLELERLTETAKTRSGELLSLVDEDAAAFEPLSQAYSIPKTEPNRVEILSEASLNACAAPVRILEECLAVTELLQRMAEICSRLMLSDVGCAASLCRAAAESAAMNVYVNLPGILDTDKAQEMKEMTGNMLSHVNEICTAVSGSVMEKLKG